MKDEFNEDFLNWLTGFFEAEGSLTIASRGDIQIVITQGYRDIHTLYYIKNTLQFGRVIKQGPYTFRFVIQDKENIIIFLSLIYNRIVTEHKLLNYNIFINYCNSKYSVDMPLQLNCTKTNLESAWLSGFVDGDGCFSISYVLTKGKFKIRFIVSQQCDLSFLKIILPQGSCEYNNSNGNCDFVITCLNTASEFKFKEVIDYFNRFPLKTSKNNSFSLWYYILNQLLFTKMDSNKESSMKTLSKLINQ